IEHWSFIGHSGLVIGHSDVPLTPSLSPSYRGKGEKDTFAHGYLGRAVTALGVFTTLFLLVGCQTARVEESLTHKLGGSDPDAQLEFWHQLATRPITCNDEAFHGLLLYVDGQDANADYSGRVSAMKSRGLLP